VTTALARCASVSPEAFAADHWSRAPLLSRAKELAGDVRDLLTDDDVDELVTARGLRTPFFRTVSSGTGLPAPVRTAVAGNRTIGDLADADGLREQHAGGATLVLQSLHRVHPPVGRLCRQLAAELGHPTQCNAYVTPGGDAQGFDFHHDTHDVFVLQVSGRKRWVIHEPVTRLPLKTQAAAGAHLVPDGAEPLLDIELEPGDALYLPRGYVHAALTTDQHSVHLTIGVLATTWFDVLTDAVTLASSEERFRDALPTPPTLEDLPAFLQDAAAWLAALPADEVRALVEKRLAKALPPEPIGVLASAAALRTLDATTAVRPRVGLAVTLQPGDPVTLTAPDRVLTLPATTHDALARALAGPCAVAHLAVGGLDADDAVVLARRLLREGILVA
jgi:ribosomal protein L16 Arg81 hydroxylase